MCLSVYLCNVYLRSINVILKCLFIILHFHETFWTLQRHQRSRKNTIIILLSFFLQFLIIRFNLSCHNSKKNWYMKKKNWYMKKKKLKISDRAEIWLKWFDASFGFCSLSYFSSSSSLFEIYWIATTDKRICVFEFLFKKLFQGKKVN
jgi:hypothetical protein